MNFASTTSIFRASLPSKTKPLKGARTIKAIALGIFAGILALALIIIFLVAANAAHSADKVLGDGSPTTRGQKAVLDSYTAQMDRQIGVGVRVTQDLVIIRNGRLVVDGIDPGHGLQIDGSIISNTGALAELPAGLHVDGSLVLTGASIENIPPGVCVTGWIDLLNCKALQTISEDLEAHVHLQINGCDSLQPLPDLRHVKCIMHGRYSVWPAKKQIHVEGLAIDSVEKSRWLGKTLNDLIGVELFEEMPIAKSPILIIRETLSARGQHTEFTIGD